MPLSRNAAKHKEFADSLKDLIDDLKRESREHKLGIGALRA